jgi:RNAse (barnase) inhibitor barstar
MPHELRKLSEPWFYSFIGSRSDLTDFSWSIAASCDLAVQIIRGLKMQTTSALFDEVAAAFQFPDYFGENWNALDECLADLSWLPAKGYVMVVHDSTEVLVREDACEFSVFVRILARVAREWSVPIEQGEAWDRPGKPFHVVLHALRDNSSQLFKMMQDTGEAIAPLEQKRGHSGSC